MVKKTLNNYTPEQLWKLERRLMMLDIKRNPESQQLFASFVMDIVGAGKARTDALAFMKASEEHGREDFNKWVAENPLSPRASLHLGMIEREIAAPFVEHSNNFRTKRKKGSIGKSQEHIKSLVAAHPTLSSKEIMKLADKEIIGEIKDTTFNNKVTFARNPKN